MNRFSLDDLIEKYENKTKLFSVMVELCTVCNCNCEYCYIDKHDNYGLKLKDIKILLFELRKLGCFQVSFTGGEIFLRKDIWLIIEYARKLGFEVLLYTNFSLLSKNDIQRLKEMNIALVSCSIFSFNEKINSDFVNYNNSVEKVKRNLIYAKEINLNIELKVMLMKFNYSSKEDIIEFCKANSINLKFDYIVYPKRTNCSCMNKYYLTKENLKKVIEKDDSYHKKIFDNNDKYICSSTRTSIFVNSNGDIFHCVNLDLYLGNIRDNSIEEIWNNNDNLHRIQNLRKFNDDCIFCNVREYCSKCIGISFRENGKIESCNSINKTIANLRKEIYE